MSDDGYELKNCPQPPPRWPITHVRQGRKPKALIFRGSPLLSGRRGKGMLGFKKPKSPKRPKAPVKFRRSSIRLGLGSRSALWKWVLRKIRAAVRSHAASGRGSYRNHGYRGASYGGRTGRAGRRR